MARMTELEKFKATCNHEKHSGFLYYASFTPDLLKRIYKNFNLDSYKSIKERLGMFSQELVIPKPINKLEPSDIEERYGRYFEGVERPEGSYINEIGVLHIPGSMYHFTHYISPLRKATSMRELESFIYPSEEPWDESHMASQVQEAHSRGYAVKGLVGHIYEDSWQIRGYEEFLTDLMIEPDMCEYILDKITNRDIRRAEAAARAGVDFLHTGDDVANQNSLMFAPDIWRKYFKSRWARVYEAARKIKPDIKIWYHSDGNIMEIIPELIEIGVDILNPVQPECLNIYEVKKKYGDKLVLDGTIGTQSTMPFGTVEDVKNAVRDRKEKLGYDGALILSPTHVLEPEVPIENILAFCEACAE